MRLRMLVTITGALAVLASPALAQRRRIPQPRRRPALAGAPGVAIRGGYDFDARVWSLGGQLELPLQRRFDLVPGGSLSFLPDRTAWQVDLEVAVRLGLWGALYTGGGLSIGNRIRDEVLAQAVGDGGPARTGGNAFVGVRPSRRLRVQPFLEGRWAFFRPTTLFQLAGGLAFPLGPAR